MISAALSIFSLECVGNFNLQMHFICANDVNRKSNEHTQHTENGTHRLIEVYSKIKREEEATNENENDEVQIKAATKL